MSVLVTEKHYLMATIWSSIFSFARTKYGVVSNFRNNFKSVFPTKRGEEVLAKYEIEKV